MQSGRKSPVILHNKNVPNSHLEKFKKTVEKKNNKKFESYWELHQWSVANFPGFWEEVWHYFDILCSEPYIKVYEKTGSGFLDCKWFLGARFNVAENILRIKDNSTAIIYADEYGCEESVTFAQMFEEVQVYAAAFKKNGLRKGDIVTSYMSNRKESVFAYLAALSIGAIHGGPHPYVQSKAVSKIINNLGAKFLLAIDHHSENGVEYHNIDHLQDVSENTSSLVKIIIVPTRPQTFKQDLSKIKNGCLLEDFLESGRNPDGTVSSLEFEQLPFDHPISVSYTSGTTGNPKGFVHAAGTLITRLVNNVLCWNLNKGDVLYTKYPVGWNIWDFFVPCLSRGVTLFLYAGSPTYVRQGINLWDIFSKYKVTLAFLSPIYIDMFEKDNIVPKNHTNLDHLKVLAMGGSPVKPQNCLFVRNKIKEDVFLYNMYGSTESLYLYSGMDFNLSTYAGEVQVPGLGVDVRCFNENGESVVNESGEMVLATPLPSLPICVWKDEDNKFMEETYLSKYPGVWYQGDEIWINPKTRGFVVRGRTDDTIKQHPHRFLANDIYSAIHRMEEIEDCICVAQQKTGGDSRAILFIQMKKGHSFTKAFTEKVEKNIANELWYKCVPELILETQGIPYNLNGKKMESVIRKIIKTNQIPTVDNIRNPESLKYFCDRPEIVNY